MVDEFDAVRAEQTELDASRRRACVEAFHLRCRAWATGEIELATLCEEAGDALEAYAVETLGALVGSTALLSPSDGIASWIFDLYRDGIASVGAAFRDALGDPSARHAVAQRLQERVLRAEARLRKATASGPLAEGTQAES